MNWLDSSEIVTGLILARRINPNSVDPQLFAEPYNKIIKMLRDDPTREIEDIISEVGLSPVQAAHEAAKTMNGLGEKNWIKILEDSALEYDAGVKLEKQSKKMQSGDGANWAEMAYIIKRAQEGESRDLVPLSKVESGDVPFIETGWKVIDDHTGGIPEVGLILVGGQPGVGKSTWATKLASQFVKKYPNKKVAFYSLEMILPELATRFREVDKLTKEQEDRILLCELPVSPEQVISSSATIDNLGLVIVDFADLMIHGESSESAYGNLYRTLMLGAKALHCPIALLAQLIKYQDSIPKPAHLRYTKMAEALAWMIIMLFDKATDWSSKEDDETLPTIDGTAFMIIWKVRGGFRKHLNDAPGAILTPFNGSKGWHPTKSKWYSLKKLS
jgi:DnaB-like helicase C terminal domain